MVRRLSHRGFTLGGLTTIYPYLLRQFGAKRLGNEEISRQLIDYLDLDWDDNCLSAIRHNPELLTSHAGRRNDFDRLPWRKPFGATHNYLIAGFDPIGNSHPQADYRLYVGRNLLGRAFFGDFVHERLTAAFHERIAGHCDGRDRRIAG